MFLSTNIDAKYNICNNLPHLASIAEVQRASMLVTESVIFWFRFFKTQLFVGFFSNFLAVGPQSSSRLMRNRALAIQGWGFDESQAGCILSIT